MGILNPSFAVDAWPWFTDECKPRYLAYIERTLVQ